MYNVSYIAMLSKFEHGEFPAAPGKSLDELDREVEYR